ncbi:MAG: gliding motility-associated C-terminal domain-containing protein [Prevotellaceae bacterium]|jgi:gliding motility-associated-like protein|nr:gliding motility-associated C-terminal domain-containing protein [Prevotellaceae bacterium]
MKKIKYIVSIMGIMFNYFVSAQIISPGAGYANFESVVYNSDVNDSIFFFTYFSSNKNSVMLKAKSMDDRPAEFEWYRFNDIDQTVSSIQVHDDMIESTVQAPLISAGGYMVVIKTEEIVDTFRAWIFYDFIAIDSVTYKQTCEYLQLTAHVSSRRDNFSAYAYFDFCDLNNVQEKYIPNSYTVEWNSDTDIYEGLDNVPQLWKKQINSLITRISSANEPTYADRPLVPGLSAPFKDASYSVKVTDVFGNMTEEYKTKQIPAKGLYAAFDVLVPDDYGVFVPTKDLNGEALWRMKLDNKSINADKFEWTGWNDQTINFLQDDTLWKYNTENILDEIHYKPGIYPVKLAVENTLTGCRHSSYALDASGKRKDIEVAKSAFSPESLPNAFTPNGDGNNDFFVFVKNQKPVSMRTMDLKIVTRNGTIVYKYKGEVSNWEGWNGKMNGNGSDCSSGVYYYIISGEGWDDKSYSGKSYSGVLHLFRGN